MLPASVKGPGLNFGFPDVCLTPVGPTVVPIPYPNNAAHAMAVGFVPNVLVAMMPALNLASMIPMTTGDEPGVAHWTYTGWAKFVAGNPVVFVGMLPGICLTCPSVGNKGNCAVATVSAPGIPNVLYTLARGAGDAASMEALLDGPPLSDERLTAEGVGVVRVNVFSFRLPAVFAAAVSRLTASGMRALVLDLRDCPGGELSAFLELAGDFLDRGAELVTMTDAEGDEIRYLARRPRAYGFPLALLVNGGTASAAELLAGCLAAHGRAVVVGAATHGKRTGQTVVRTAAGEPTLVTAARFATAGAPLDGQGRVVPHLEVPDGDAMAAALRHLDGA